MSSVNRDGTWIPHNTQEGVFVVVKATNAYVSGCFNEYPWHPDPTGQYAALYRPYHYVGLELNVSIANAVLRGIPTGSPIGFFGDVVATAKKDLKAGEFLDGEGGYTVWGQLVSAKHSVTTGALPVAWPTTWNCSMTSPRAGSSAGKTSSWTTRSPRPSNCAAKPKPLPLRQCRSSWS